ncbi:MAG: class I SAM-dependent methyltransferase [Chloroflexi bacterium]|nr:class I SAM-dependent methyltransferase [Chloroflexota bacterium]
MNRWWLLPLAAVGAGLFARGLRRAELHQTLENLRAFDMPSAWLYDAIFGARAEGAYRQIASELAAVCPEGALLEVGCGPGRLAVHLAHLAPRLAITGADLSTGMVERASQRAARAGVAQRVRFQIADAAELPYPDRHFDLVASTFTFHHFARPARALGEIHRVLKPGAEAWLYDVPDWLVHTMHQARLSEHAPESPFRGVDIQWVLWRGLAPLYLRFRLRRTQP